MVIIEVFYRGQIIYATILDIALTITNVAVVAIAIWSIVLILRIINIGHNNGCSRVMILEDIVKYGRCGLNGDPVVVLTMSRLRSQSQTFI
jgi:hypothetical protein